MTDKEKAKEKSTKDEKKTTKDKSNANYQSHADAGGFPGGENNPDDKNWRLLNC